MRLIIHTGWHKTGTSSLQGFCEENRERLAEIGLLYPRSGIGNIEFKSVDTAFCGHRKFSAVLAAPNSVSATALLENIKDEAEQSNCSSVLISSETLSAADQRISELLPASLARFFDEVKILSYVRRQDDWAESFYREILCWSGQKIKFDFNNFCSGFLKPWLDYPERLAVWERLFGAENLIVKSYNDRTYPNIVEDILKTIGYEMPPGLDNKSLNPSLPVNLVPFLLNVNRRNVSQQTKSEITRRLFRLLDESEQTRQVKPLRSDYLASQLEAFTTQNEILAVKYNMLPAPIFTFETTPDAWTKSRLEKTLEKEQLQSLLSAVPKKTAASDFIRKNDGTWGITVLCNESLVQIGSFIDYHLAIGASKMIVYLDNPDDPVQSAIVDDRVEFVRCTPDFWFGLLGRQPESNFEKLSVSHSIGLKQLRDEDGLDWAINIDADELLWVAPGNTAKGILSELSAECTQVHFYPREAVFVDKEDSAVFAARYFKILRKIPQEEPNPANAEPKLIRRMAKKLLERISKYTPLSSGKAPLLFQKILPRLGLGGFEASWKLDSFEFQTWREKDQHLYDRAMPVISDLMNTGFLGHRQGRVATAKGIELDDIGSHRHFSSTTKIVKHGSGGRIYLLHYDAVDYDAWYLKWHRRVFGDAKVHKIGAGRKKQQDLFEKSVANGNSRELFEGMFFVPKPFLGKMLRQKLLAQMDVPHIADITARWRKIAEKDGREQPLQ